MISRTARPSGLRPERHPGLVSRGTQVAVSRPKARGRAQTSGQEETASPETSGSGFDRPSQRRPKEADSASASAWLAWRRPMPPRMAVSAADVLLGWRLPSCPPAREALDGESRLSALWQARSIFNPPRSSAREAPCKRPCRILGQPVRSSSPKSGHRPPWKI
ncbi:hypothetical protein B0T18DRAFT_415642 [Schizothecium vesticola]|uniref:Uncharacterized protein n=1 Tax=Schizothecium vesticola TaxID=314040 RepID=A0AA40K2M7_9PEZI|nr:hypothetical protein B0T18DRAFT_415642 [Schizothecium vesticola]